MIKIVAADYESLQRRLDEGGRLSRSSAAA
jgi:hypothetical protein